MLKSLLSLWKWTGQTRVYPQFMRLSRNFKKLRSANLTRDDSQISQPIHEELHRQRHK